MQNYSEHLFNPNTTLNEISFKSPIMSKILSNAENHKSFQMPDRKDYPDMKSWLNALKDDKSSERKMNFTTRLMKAQNRSSFNDNQRKMADTLSKLNGVSVKPKTWFDFEHK